MDQRHSIILLDPDPRVTAAVRLVLRKHFNVEVARTVNEATVLLARGQYVAVISDWAERFGEEGAAFAVLLQHCWPMIRRLTFAHHVAPHLDSLERNRPKLWINQAHEHAVALLDALMLSETDPVFASPYAN